MPNRWYFEHLSPDQFLASAVASQVYAGRTPYQEVYILDLEPFGRALVLDGKTQSTTSDEHIYHESLVHPAMLSHPAPRRVVVCGGGEGATLREVLRHPPVERAVMVDIDAEVVDVCRRYLPTLHQGSFDHPKAQLHIGDARAYLEALPPGEADVIICDLADPIEAGPAYLLYTQEFYAMVRERLAPDGVLVTQAGPAGPHNCTEVLTAVTRTLQTVFPSVRPYTQSMPSFGSTWGFVLAQRKDAPPLAPETLEERLRQRLGDALRYYDAEVYRHQFALPRYIREAIAQEQRIIRDDQPIYMP